MRVMLEVEVRKNGSTIRNFNAVRVETTKLQSGTIEAIIHANGRSYGYNLDIYQIIIH